MHSNPNGACLGTVRSENPRQAGRLLGGIEARLTSPDPMERQP